MLEIGCQTYSLRTRPLDDMLTSLRKAGFRAIELWVGHADHAAGAPAAAPVRRAAEDLGLHIRAYSAGGFVRAGVATVVERLESAFAYAAALGVDLVTGVVDRRAVPAVDALCRRTGMRFAVENHWYGDLATARALERALDDASPLVGVALDTGHLAVAGGDPVEAAALLGPRLLDVHLKAVEVTPRLQRWLWRRPRMATRTIALHDAALATFVAALVHAEWDGLVAIEDERPAVPLAELHASLRAATGMLRAARPAVSELGA
jgi:sugar phosphate isomerase/epimerase